MTRIEALRVLNQMYERLQLENKKPQPTKERERIQEEMKAISYSIRTLVSNQNREGEQLQIK